MMNCVCSVCGLKYSEHKRPDMPKKVYWYYMDEEIKAYMKEREKAKMSQQKEMRELEDKQLKEKRIVNEVDKYQKKKSKHLKL